MKKFNLTSFIAGFVIAIAITAFFAFRISNDVKKSESGFLPVSVETISNTKAVKFRNNFKSIFPGAISGINISLAQLDAMKEAVRAMEGNTNNISGFRMYFGAESTDANSPINSIVYPLDNNLNQVESNGDLFMASGFAREFRQECPPFCD